MLGFAIAIPTTSFAQSVTIDLKNIDPKLATEILKAQKDSTQKNVVPTTPAQAKEWATIGEEVAKAIAATAKALSIEVNEFVKTPVGKWTLFFIFWFLLGKKLWMIVGGTIAWIALGALIWKSFNHFHLPQKKLVEEKGDTKKYEYVKFDFNSKDARTVSAIVHVGIFCATSIVMMIIIF